MRFKPTIILDFDGVIHSYRSGWRGAANIPDPPVEGIKAAVANIRKYYKVVVVSSRCYHPGGIAAIQGWLADHDIVVDAVTGEKPPAKVIVDDRAITFDGDAAALLAKINSFQPWTSRTAAASSQPGRLHRQRSADKPGKVYKG